MSDLIPNPQPISKARMHVPSLYLNLNTIVIIECRLSVSTSLSISLSVLGIEFPELTKLHS